MSVTENTGHEPGLLRIADVSRRTGFHRTTISRAISSGELRAFRFGRSVRIDQSDLIEWQEKHRATTGRRAA